MDFGTCKWGRRLDFFSTGGVDSYVVAIVLRVIIAVYPTVYPITVKVYFLLYT